MKIVYFGSSEFSMPSMRALIASRHKVAALVTQPDRKKGRKLAVAPPPTKVLAAAEKIEVFQPEDASDRESVEFLNDLDADIFVVVSFGQILSKEVLGLARHPALNLHASLLPRYRGAAPTNWAIINGDSVTGVTIMKMSERLDEGDIVLKKEVKIDADDTNITLSETLSEKGAAALLEALDLIEARTARFEKQDASQATYAPKLKKGMGLIDWNESTVKIHNKIRGFLPWPGAYTHYKGKILKVLEAHIAGRQDGGGVSPGTVTAVTRDEGIVVRTGSGDIALKYIQLEGKKILDADAFVRGHRIEPGFKFP